MIKLIIALIGILLYALITNTNAQCLNYPLGKTLQILDCISFADPLHGLIGSSASKVFRTSDGGLTWSEHIVSDSISTRITDISMIDSAHAFAVTATGHFYQTENGGYYWRFKGRPITSQLYSVSFLNQEHGIILGNRTIMTTTDGGNTWSYWDIGRNAILNDVQLIDSLNGVVVGEYGIILRSSDGGKSWLYQTTPTQNDLWSVSFSDKNIGTAVGTTSTKTTILRTTNGGMNWTLQKIDEMMQLYGVSFLNSNIGVAVGDGHLISTLNGGSTWNIHHLSPYNYQNVVFLKSGAILTNGNQYDWRYNKTWYMIVHIDKRDCQTTINLETPADGAIKVPLNPDMSTPMSLILSWSYSDWVIVTQSIVQVALDSNFTSDLIVDTLLSTNDITNSTLLLQNMKPTTKYYWRVGLKFLDGTNSSWSRISRFSTASGMIRGIVFNDLNRNGLHAADEPGMPQWTLSIGGKISATIRTNETGDFFLSGIDSGTYIIIDNVITAWRRSCPDTNFYIITLGENDTLSGYKFGRYFPWNSISGILFDDFNENGTKDADEQGLANWLVRIEGFFQSDTTSTNSLGYYSFNEISLGSYTVTPIIKQSWEQIYPIYQEGYSFSFNQYDNHHSGVNFSLHPIPERVKIVLRVHDNRRNQIQSIRWGVRSGATYGIWGVDSQCSVIDFSEGEFEIPPRLPGSFDVRFEDPHHPSSRFGLGSWTDMRAFTSPSQIDTYQVRFYPGVNLGGGYPITFFWSKESVEASYSGSVLIGNGNDLSIDMTRNDSLVVINTNTSVLKIIANSPILQPTDVRTKNEIIPHDYYLEQNYPNPFNSITDIGYQISDVSFVTLKVYNILGQEITTLVNSVKQPGKYIVRWNTSTLDGELPSGIYFYRMICGDYSATKKLLFLK